MTGIQKEFQKTVNILTIGMDLLLDRFFYRHPLVCSDQNVTDLPRIYYNAFLYETSLQSTP